MILGKNDNFDFDGVQVLALSGVWLGLGFPVFFVKAVREAEAGLFKATIDVGGSSRNSVDGSVLGDDSAGDGDGGQVDAGELIGETLILP